MHHNFLSWNHWVAFSSSGVPLNSQKASAKLSSWSPPLSSMSVSPDVFWRFHFSGKVFLYEHSQKKMHKLTGKPSPDSTSVKLYLKFYHSYVIVTHFQQDQDMLWGLKLLYWFPVSAATHEKVCSKSVKSLLFKEHEFVKNKVKKGLTELSENLTV